MTASTTILRAGLLSYTVSSPLFLLLSPRFNPYVPPLTSSLPLSPVPTLLASPVGGAGGATYIKRAGNGYYYYVDDKCIVGIGARLRRSAKRGEVCERRPGYETVAGGVLRGGGGQLSLLLEEMQRNACILMGSVISLEKKGHFDFFSRFFLLTLSSNYGKEECCNVSIRGEECPLREKCFDAYFFAFTAGA